MPRGRPSYAEIDLEALADNYALASRLASGREVIGVVKANAYGHGAPAIARHLESIGCRTLAVVTVAEARVLRDAGVSAALLVMGGVHDAAEAAEAVKLETTPVIQRKADIDRLAKAAGARRRRLPVQLEVDTGMCRMGAAPEEVVPLVSRIAEREALALDGLYTHFARADEPDPEPTREQQRRFAGVLAAVRERFGLPRSVHAAASAALLAGLATSELLPELNAVRPGLMLYGIAPSPELETAPNTLRPVMRLAARIVALRRVPPGQGVGYGATFRPAVETTIATLPVGYADGIPRHLTDTAFVSHRGRNVPIVGRVSMDFVTVDLGDHPAAIGDEVVVFGPGQSVTRLAAASDTIAYELLVRVGERVPRAVLAEEA